MSAKNNMESQRLLSQREKEVLWLIVKEMNTDEIAKELYISRGTVESHRKNIMSKLKVKNVAGIIRKSFNLGILYLDKNRDVAIID